MDANDAKKLDKICLAVTLELKKETLRIMEAKYPMTPETAPEKMGAYRLIARAMLEAYLLGERFGRKGDKE